MPGSSTSTATSDTHSGADLCRIVCVVAAIPRSIKFGECTLAVNAFISFFDKAAGESVQKTKKDWVEIQSWDWEVEAETSWTKGGGASVGKPNPGTMNFEHYFDTSSTVVLGYICSGKSFPKVELQVTRSTGSKGPDTYFTMTMEGAFITKVSNSGDEEGKVVQRIEMVFKTVKIEYRPQSPTGQLGVAKIYSWDIPAGKASPSA